MNQKFNKQDYHYLGRYKTPVLYCYICMPNIKKYKRMLPLNVSFFLDGHQFLEKKNWDLIKHDSLKAIEEHNNKFFEQLFDLSRLTTKKVIKASRVLLKKDKVRIKDIKDFFDYINSMEYPWCYSLPISEGFEELLNQLVADEKIKAKAAETFFSFQQPTLLIRQQNELLKIKSQIDKKILLQMSKMPEGSALELLKSKNKKIYGKIKNHVQKYQWFGMMHFWGEPFTEEKFISQLLASGFKASEKKSKMIMSRKQNYFRGIATKVAYWRQIYAETCAIASYSAFKVLGKLGRQKSGLSYNSLIWLTPPEFISLLNKKFKPDFKVLNQRKKGFGIVQANNKKVVITGKKLDLLVNQLLEKPKMVSEIKGTPANKGLARGRVKIVLAPSELGKVNRGDIMVAGETTPDFMPAINRVKALITDIGGIASHAAIVSREFDIPCVIGTKIATQVFKDNDLIEVDANKGIIRKIKARKPLRSQKNYR